MCMEDTTAATYSLEVYEVYEYVYIYTVVVFLGENSCDRNLIQKTKRRQNRRKKD